jgi:hypothetical protein
MLLLALLLQVLLVRCSWVAGSGCQDPHRLLTGHHQDGALLLLLLLPTLLLQ